MAALHAGGCVMAQKSEARAAIARCPGFPSWGGDLLSRFRSTIGAAWLNFSVRDGKRWIPRAVPALIFFFLAAGLRPRGMTWRVKDTAYTLFSFGCYQELFV